MVESLKSIDWSSIGESIQAPPIQLETPQGIDWSAISAPETIPSHGPNYKPQDKISWSGDMLSTAVAELADDWAGIKYGVGRSTLHTTDVLNKLAIRSAESTGPPMKYMGIDIPRNKTIDEALVSLTSWMKDWAQKDLPPKPKTFAGRVVSDFASAGVGVAQIVGIAAVTKSPSIAMAILGAAEGGAEHGTIGAAKGAASGFMLGKVLGATSYLPKILSIGTNATVFGGMTAVELVAQRGGIENLTPEDKDDIAIQSMIGGILSLPGKNPTIRQFAREYKLRGFDENIVTRAWDKYQVMRAEKAALNEQDTLNRIAGTSSGIEELSSLGAKLEAAAKKTPEELAHSTEPVASFNAPVFIREGFLKEEPVNKVRDANSYYVTVDRNHNAKRNGVPVDVETGTIDTFPVSKQGLSDAINSATGSGKMVVRVKDIVPVEGKLVDNISSVNVNKVVWREKLKKVDETAIGTAEESAMVPLETVPKALEVSQKLRQEELDKAALSVEDRGKIAELDKVYGEEYTQWLKDNINVVPVNEVPMNINDWFNQYKGDKPTKLLGPVENLPVDFKVDITTIHSKSGKESKVKEKPDVALKEIDSNISKYDALLRCLRK